MQQTMNIKASVHSAHEWNVKGHRQQQISMLGLLALTLNHCKTLWDSEMNWTSKNVPWIRYRYCSVDYRPASQWCKSNTRRARGFSRNNVIAATSKVWRHIRFRQSMRIQLRNNSAKFHPDRI